MDNKEKVIDVVSNVFGVTPKQLLSKSRKRSIVYPRIALIVALRCLGYSVRQVIDIVHLNRSTIFYHEHYSFEMLMEQDSIFCVNYNLVLNKIKKDNQLSWKN